MKILWGDIDEGQQELLRELVGVIAKDPVGRLAITNISTISAQELDDLAETMQNVAIWEYERYE